MRLFINGRLVVVLLTLTMLGVGCSTGNYHSWHVEDRKAPTGIATIEAVTVVLDHSAEEFSLEEEAEITSCISEAMRSAHPTLQIIAPDEFRRTAFPDLVPEEVPPRSWDQLLTDAAFRDRMAPLGIRYLIDVTVTDGRGVQEQVPGGETWEPWTRLEAKVVDLMHAHIVGSVEAVASGESAFGFTPLTFIFPVIITSYPEERACQELGKALVKFLAGGPRERFTVSWLGVTLKGEGGILTVEKVHHSSLAEGTGLKSGDWLLRYRGTLVTDRASLEEAICTPTISEVVIITLKRADQTMNKSLSSADFGCPNPTVSVAPQ